MAPRSIAPGRTVGAVRVHAGPATDSRALLDWIMTEAPDLAFDDGGDDPAPGDVFLVVDDAERAGRWSARGARGVLAASRATPAPPPARGRIDCLCVAGAAEREPAPGWRRVGGAVQSRRRRPGTARHCAVWIMPETDSGATAADVSVAAATLLRERLAGWSAVAGLPAGAAAGALAGLPRVPALDLADAALLVTVPSPLAVAEALRAGVPTVLLPATGPTQAATRAAALLNTTAVAAEDLADPADVPAIRSLRPDPATEDGRAVSRVARQLRQLVLAPF